LKPLFLLIFPLPVTLNLLAAALLVLILGTGCLLIFGLLSSLLRREQHGHVPPL
jgi:hypothetical protein